MLQIYTKQNLNGFYCSERVCDVRIMAKSGVSRVNKKSLCTDFDETIHFAMVKGIQSLLKVIEHLDDNFNYYFYYYCQNCFCCFLLCPLYCWLMPRQTIFVVRIV